MKSRTGFGSISGRLAPGDPAHAGLGFRLHGRDQQADPVVFRSVIPTMAATARASLASRVMPRAAADPRVGVALLEMYTRG